MTAKNGSQENGSPTKVAIACQGGGSHTAFTAGVLQGLLADDGAEVVALSGTSGGAICALLAWQGLSRGDRTMAVESLRAFWADNAASDTWDAAVNAWLVGASRLEGTLTLPAISPYQFPPVAERRFRELLERHVRTPVEQAPQPLLLLGAVDVLSGEFRAFSSARGEISIDAVLASAAIPNLFRAVTIDGRPYWDGLFSQNPPVRELPEADPDEIWVVQVNPSGRAEEPTSAADIGDRRNELAGNLSLSQELFFIDKMNELVATGALAGTKYRHIEVRTIALGHDLDYASKLDRDPEFLVGLMDEGRRRAAEFLAGRSRAAA